MVLYFRVYFLKLIVMKIIVFIYSILFAICTNAFSSTIHIKDSLECLKISGELFYNNKPYKNGEVTLFLHNDSVAYMHTNKKGEFEFTLQRNQHYTIRIRGKEIFDKLVSINTIIYEEYPDHDVLWKFTFEIHLNKKIKEYHNEDALDFPFALISYNPHHDSFIYDRNYTSIIRKEVDLAIAKLSGEKSVENFKKGLLLKPDANDIQRRIDEE